MSLQGTPGFIRKIQTFMGSYRGKVLLNYAYSWGAAIVILGALFKLTHIPGANMMLWIGMGTEVVVFFISAFDLPARQRNDDTGFIVAESPLPHNCPGNIRPAEITPVVSITHGNMDEVTTDYLNQLKEATDMLSKLTRQMEGIVHDSGKMEDLNKSLTGINAIYDIQLKNLSSQIGTIDQVHEQIRKMAQQIEKLNAVYARMLDAMNANGK